MVLAIDAIEEDRQPGVTRGPDFVVNGVTVTQFDATGRATNRLHASELMHFATDDHSELSQPRLITYGPDNLCEVRAKSANVESSARASSLSATLS